MKRINLTRGKEALVDDEDFEKIGLHKWYCSSYGYAVRNSPRKKGPQVRVYMHREIMHAPKDFEVDHINGDRLDNRKSNLRLCTRAQNMSNTPARATNTSGFKGVHLTSRGWQARIQVNCKRIFLGRYKTASLAGEAYNNACHRYHGEFSNTNLTEVIDGTT